MHWFFQSRKINLFVIFLLFSLQVFSIQAQTAIVPGVSAGRFNLDSGYPEIKGILDQEYRTIQQTAYDNKIDIYSYADRTELWLTSAYMGMNFIFDYDTKKLIRILVLSTALNIRNTNIRVNSPSTILGTYPKYKRINLEPDRTVIHDKSSFIVAYDYPELGVNIWVDYFRKIIYAIEIYIPDERHR